MSEQEFEAYLILLSRFLGLSPDQRDSIAEELRDHMHQRLEALQRLGIPRNEAVREALAEFGDASRLASELSHLANRKQQNSLDLTTVCANGVLMITSMEVAENEHTTRLYPVWDLVRLPIETKDGSRSDYDSLLDVITATVSPESWQDLGGPGSLAPRKGLLLISQTDEVQIQIEAFLNALREFTRPEASATENPGAVRRAIVDVGDDAANRLISDKLDKEISVDFVDAPLDDVAEYLQQTMQVPVIIDHRALDSIGVDSSSAANTLSLQGVSLRSALRLMLAKLDLTYILRDEALVITSQEEAENLLTTRLYSAADLIDIVDATDYEQIKVELEELADVLMTIVGPESWSNVGGPGVLKVYASRGVLVCSNTSEVHEQIEELLGDMARARRSPPRDGRNLTIRPKSSWKPTN